MASILPDTCCRNAAHERGLEGFVPCGETATKWYLHGQDICSYCDRHDYPCGHPLTPLKEETQDMSNISNTLHYPPATAVGTKFAALQSYSPTGWRHVARPKVYRTAGALARKIRYRSKDLGTATPLRVVSVDLTTGDRVERTPQDFVKFVDEYRTASKAKVKRLDKPVKALFDNSGKPCALGDEVVAASYMGRPYRGKISGFTPHNVQIVVVGEKYSYNKYVAYSRFSRAVLKLS